MKKKEKNYLGIAICLLILFIIWTYIVKRVDVQMIGPKHSVVGLATMNRWFRHLTGVHMILYKLTDWLSLIPLFVVVGFTIMGLVQLMQRKNILKVDKDILLLGGFYIVVLVMFLFFENNIINYRPVCIEGHLEASYPSSTTLLVMCVMPTTILQLQYRMQNIKRRKILSIVLSVFTAMMVLGRIISGVHWISDIIGGLLLSMGLVTFYDGLVQYNKCLK